MTFTFKDVPVVSYKVLAEIKMALESRKKSMKASFDLGISSEIVYLDYEHYSFKLKNSMNVVLPESFDPEQKVCYFIQEGQLYPLKLFSEETNFYYALVPTSWRPILRISATPMHKKPFLDALEKLQFRGFVLDSGTGLGYSAIVASKTATRVTTIEWDENVLEIASFNPHSRELFSADNIEIRQDDVTAEIFSFDDNYFDNIIHDGGMPKSSGNFFSQDHCNQIYRVLKQGGELIFYLPQHGRSKGRDYGGEHLERLKKAGFFIKKRDIEGSYALLYK